VVQNRGKEELERRVEQSRRLAKGANDPITTRRLVDLIDDLERQQQQQKPEPNIYGTEHGGRRL
jgi:hypothetical protein